MYSNFHRSQSHFHPEWEAMLLMFQKLQAWLFFFLERRMEARRLTSLPQALENVLYQSTVTSCMVFFYLFIFFCTSYPRSCCNCFCSYPHGTLWHNEDLFIFLWCLQPWFSSQHASKPRAPFFFTPTLPWYAEMVNKLLQNQSKETVKDVKAGSLGLPSCLAASRETSNATGK